jgi:hypothetical protein
MSGSLIRKLFAMYEDERSRSLARWRHTLNQVREDDSLTATRGQRDSYTALAFIDSSQARLDALFLVWAERHRIASEA